MRILLLNPPRYRGIPVVRVFRSEYLYVEGNIVPPVDLAYFAAGARDRAQVRIVDANVEDLDQRQCLERIEAFAPDVIVVKGVLNILEHDLAAVLQHKRRCPRTRVILSCRGVFGVEARIFDEFPDLDGIAAGEVDAFSEDICDLSDLEALGSIEGMSVPDGISGTVRVVHDLERHPHPDLEALPPLWHTGYRLPYGGAKSGYYLVAARGCPFSCTFCNVGGLPSRSFTYRRRDPASVVEEVRFLRKRFGIGDFFVFDENFTMPGHCEQICERLLNEDARPAFTCEGKPGLVNRSMLELLARSGCRGLFYGIESGDQGILAEINKGHDLSQARQAIRWTKQASLLAGAYVVLGFPQETWATFFRTVGFLFETAPEMIRYDFLLPYPGTSLHRQMRMEGLLGRAGFDRTTLDRRTSPDHRTKIPLSSRALSPRELMVMDRLFKEIFAEELCRAPVA